MAYKLPALSEHVEQKNLFQWLRRVAVIDEPLVEFLVFAVSNGAKLGGSEKLRAIQMHNLKDEGFLPGVSDVLCLIPRRGYNYMAVEMKKTGIQNKKENGFITGGVSASQREFLSHVKLAGGLDSVCYGAEEAKELFKWYLDIKQDL